MSTSSFLLVDLCPSTGERIEHICSGYHFGVDRNKLCSKSTVFKTEIEDCQVKETGMLHIDSKHDARAILQMAQFMNKGNYDDGVAEKFEGAEVETLNLDLSTLSEQEMVYQTILSHIKVNRIAHDYDIKRLKEIANERIKGFLEAEWPLDDTQVFSIVREACSGDTALHEIIFPTVMKNIRKLCDHDLRQIMSPFGPQIIRKLVRWVRIREDDPDDSSTDDELDNLSTKNKLNDLTANTPNFKGDISDSENVRKLEAALSESENLCDLQALLREAQAREDRFYIEMNRLYDLNDIRHCQNMVCDIEFTCKTKTEFSDEWPGERPVLCCSGCKRTIC